MDPTGNYVVHNTMLPPQEGLNEVLDPETASEVHEAAGLPILAKNADRRETVLAYGIEPLDMYDADLWRRAFSNVSSLRQVIDPRLPAPIVAALQRARQQKLFDSIECWMRNPGESRSHEMVFVGIIGNQRPHIDPTTYYVLAQWVPPQQNHVYTTTESLRTRARGANHPLLFWRHQHDKAKVALGSSAALVAYAAFISGSWESVVVAVGSSFLTWMFGQWLNDGEQDLNDASNVASVMLIVSVIASAIVRGVAGI